MKRIVSAICATALSAAIAVTGLLPASAAPVYVPKAAAAQGQSDVTQVQDRRIRRYHRNRHGFDRRHFRDARRHYRHGPRYGYHNGYRGYRYKRRGYRYHDGWWFPGAAFLGGAIIGGAIANSNNYPRYGGSAHVQWCYDRYRSYRASDNTFQPYNGPRRQCYSPYS
jgi:Ni/Co efflux regulator RcnB